MINPIIMIPIAPNTHLIRIFLFEVLLLIEPGIWRELEDFSSGAVCMVIASDLFDLNDYIYDYDEFKKIYG